MARFVRVLRIRSVWVVLSSRGPRSPGLRGASIRRGLISVAACTLVLAVVTGSVTVAAADPVEAQDGTDEVRIVARRLADGRVEFGLQARAAGDSWGERLLPSRRFFPTSASVGRWLVSSPLETVEETATRPEETTLAYSCNREDLELLSWCQMSEGDWRAVDRHLNICEAGRYTTFSESGDVCGPYDPNFDPHPYACGPVLATPYIVSSYVYDHSRNVYPTINTAGGCLRPISEWWFGPTRVYSEVGGQCNARDQYFGRMFEICVSIETPTEELEPWQYRASGSFTSHIQSIMSDEEIAELSDEEFEQLLDPWLRAIEEHAKRPYHALDLPFVRAWCEAHSAEGYDQAIVQGFCAVLED